ncbi:MAG: TIGR04211 family SH3 domain-containing protein [Steroidobacter sp.]
MKIHNASCCLAAATLLMAFSVISTAQEEEQEQEPPQRLFVSDKLVLNVYAEADQSGERVATIETGDAVEELERAESFVRVRLEDGREGWVGANYLTAEAPAVVRLRDIQREQKSGVQAADKKAADEIARLKKQNAALQGEVKDLKAKAVAPVAAAVETPDEEPAELEEDSGQELAAAETPREGGAPWIWPVLVLVAGGGGFFLGYQMLARRIREKFGGLKVY